eukprot:jgi/Mesen1/4029/ME000212S03048
MMSAAGSTSILQHISQLAHCRLVLASASPRRSELLRAIGLNPEVVPSSFEENLDKASFSGPGDAGKGGAPLLIVAADTIVELDGLIMEKPRDEADAFSMLRTLSGRRHRVYTGVALLLPSSSSPRPAEKDAATLRLFDECTEVEFGKLEDADLWAYIATGQPMDKSGAYGIQGLGGSMVRGITGCYFNVMGFPLHRFGAEVKQLIDSGLLPLPTPAASVPPSPGVLAV